MLLLVFIVLVLVLSLPRKAFSHIILQYNWSTQKNPALHDEKPSSSSSSFNVSHKTKTQNEHNRKSSESKTPRKRTNYSIFFDFTFIYGLAFVCKAIKWRVMTILSGDFSANRVGRKDFFAPFSMPQNEINFYFMPFTTPTNL